ncbi:MAG: large subunit ribosomal protein L9 [Crocinitomicaceae bacterium]|jgi:large subunit ribosomal protein L9
MKVILLQQIKGKGAKGDIIEVSDGYAQNALLPRGLAKVATNTELNKIKLAEESSKLKTQKDIDHAHRVLGIVNGKNIIITEKLNEKGSLYHALGLKEITKAVHEQLGVSTPSEMYAEKYALKNSGEYTLILESNNQKAEIHLLIESK